ncbi:putative quinol monooxygenase [Pseudonocardia endophytica]|uniref:Quinol monooxygenase YgiN n=1 Tax=Pseudonocardia endophytica TaxID=401976 RepID=A0A4R1HZX8_PSEEN|nr:antibiotic biosynthesis monooxygenase family protein [Pseudonocardia endophytica]TCK27131.1 quinol monooxygenase YgiN [Pseudonocardia endophytica]
MWIIAGHVTVDEDRRDEYLAAHHDLVERARRAPGCLDVAITPDPVVAGRIYNYERWETWEAIEVWRTVAHAPDTGITMRDVEVTAYEVARSTPPF